MAPRALFGGLVIDESGTPVGVSQVGGEAFYVVDDDGFLRHIESEKIDRQVLEQMRELIQGHEDMISEGTMKMLGQEDIFTKAMIESSLRDLDDQFERLIAAGLPEEGLPAGTRWEDVPVNWVCPECGARKEDFELVEI